MKVNKIIIASENNGPIIGGQEYVNDNSNVWVEFDNGSIYVATMFTYKNIEWLKNKNVNTGECLGGKYFWASDMLIVESLDRASVEEIIFELIREDEFNQIFTESALNKSVWVFNGVDSRFSGGVFENLAGAEKWIKKNTLSGMLTEYPVNEGVFDWADENDLINMKPEKLSEKRKDPVFIGGFTSASMKHHHYEDGEKQT